MSTKAYVGEWVTGYPWSAYPAHKCLLYPADNTVEDYRTRFGYRSCGDGPYLVARFKKDALSPSTGGFGSAVYSVVVGTWGMGNGVASVQLGTSERFWYTQWQGDFNMHYEYRTVKKVLEPMSRYPKFVQHRVRYSYGPSYTGDRVAPKWFTPWSPDEKGYDVGLKQLAAARANLRVFHLEADTDEIVRISTPLVRVNWDLGLDRDFIDSIKYPCEAYLMLGILPGPWARGFETAYIQACKSLPDASVNMGANIIEASSLLAKLFCGDIFSAVPRTAKQAWLSYRYAYNTTKMDVSEIKETVNRLDQLISVPEVRTYGSYVRGDVRYKVGFHIDSSEILPQEVSETLRRFGLELNALNVWDMIPYSFVVDWFIPVGKIIEYFQDMAYTVEMKPREIWWSMVTTKGDTEIYVRLPGRQLSTFPYLDIRDPSKKTVFMRCADAIALFT